MKKLGLICLAIVLALGAMGVGYAMWFDTITISGTVQTGTVDLNVVGYSWSKVYKNLDNDSMVIWHHDPFLPDQPPTGNLLEVSNSTCVPGVEDDTVVISYNNAFPLAPLTNDIVLEYRGTVPAKLKFDVDYDQGSYWADKYLTYQAAWFNPLTEHLEPVDPTGFQMHYGDRMHLYATLLMDNDAPQHTTATGTVTITAVQWNEYVP